MAQSETIFLRRNDETYRWMYSGISSQTNGMFAGGLHWTAGPGPGSRLQVDRSLPHIEGRGGMAIKWTCYML